MYYNNISNDDDIEIIYWGNEEENNTVNSDKIKKHRKKKDDYDWKKEAMGFLKIIAIAVVIAFAINNLVIINAKVPSGSMEKTIKKHSRMVGFRLSYVFSKPKSGDIIIFKYPEDESQYFVKRVIATPEDEVEITNGVVCVNRKEINEPYVYYDDGTPDADGDFPKTKVPKGCYFVLGDNRNNSKDSRFWVTTHFVKESQILGKAIFSYYPSVYMLK